MSKLIQTVAGIAVCIAFALMLVMSITGEETTWQPNPATGIPTEVQPR